VEQAENREKASTLVMGEKPNGKCQFMGLGLMNPMCPGSSGFRTSQQCFRHPRLRLILEPALA
jgi:hypothetical protein